MAVLEILILGTSFITNFDHFGNSHAIFPPFEESNSISGAILNLNLKNEPKRPDYEEMDPRSNIFRCNQVSKKWGLYSKSWKILKSSSKVHIS